MLGSIYCCRHSRNRPALLAPDINVNCNHSPYQIIKMDSQMRAHAGTPDWGYFGPCTKFDEPLPKYPYNITSLTHKLRPAKNSRIKAHERACAGAGILYYIVRTQLYYFIVVNTAIYDKTNATQTHIRSPSLGGPGPYIYPIYAIHACIAYTHCAR